MQRRFDALAEGNDFWTRSIDDINRGIAKMHRDDKKFRLGVDLVVGCPLPAVVQEKLVSVQHLLDKELHDRESRARILWRENTRGFHLTVCRLIAKERYREGVSWPLDSQLLASIREICREFADIKLAIQGVNILGRGAICVGMSDSDAIDRMRERLSVLEGVDGPKFKNPANKIALGRVLPTLTPSGRDILREICLSLRDYEVGTIDASSLKIVHADNKFLENPKDSLDL